MHIDPEIDKAYNIEPDMCWECLSCVKACPERAIEVRPYADISPLGSEISVDRDEDRNTIRWNITYRDSRKKEFEFQIRTTPWDTIRLPEIPDGDGFSLDDQELSQSPGFMSKSGEADAKEERNKGKGGD